MKEMECIVKRRYGLKQSYQQMMEDFRNSFAQNYQNNVASTTPTPVPGEDFVDQLLNLNNEEDDEEFEPEIDFVVVKQEKSEQVIEDNQTPNSKKISPFLSPPNLDSVLSVPAEEADLEWLSQFVEESFSQFSNPYPAGFVKPKPKVVPEGVSFTPQSPSKSRRSKRARTGGRVWTTALSDPSSPSSPEVATSYKQQKKEAGQKVNGPGFGGGVGLSRRCSHCGVQKTPQWRAGPMGAKTLCNACGVRYKSGRLVPEYRPACSPTFSSELHSNSHRKILEMRKKKEIMVQPESGSLPHPVSSFG